jgi:hypothetical protein
VKKAINFQCSSAHVQTWLAVSNPTIAIGSGAASKLLGGTWVGGTLELTENTIKIFPNWANRQVMQGIDELVIPHSNVTGIELNKGFVTNTIDINFSSTQIKIRCWGAEKLINNLRAALSLH